METKPRKLVGAGKFRGTLVRFWFLLAATPALGCGSSAPSENADGSVEGELHIYRFNYDDGRTARDFYLARDEHSPATTRLMFAKDPQLEPWTRLKVWGTRSSEGINVTRFEPEIPDEDVGTSSQALTMVTPRPRTVGFVMMDVGAGVSLTADAAQTAIFGTRMATQAGLSQYYREVSYGAVTMSGEILGPVMNSTLGSCQQSAITQIENSWPTQLGKSFDHWMTYIGSKYADCGWSGIGGEGTAARPAKGSWYNGSTGCTVLAQEVGHNFGMMHSGSLTCSGTPLADDPLTCMGSEYGSRNTVMGSGCAHLNAYEKWYEGFFGGCNGVRVGASGTFTLYPTELPCDGVQALQIPMPKSRPFHNTSGTTTQITLTKYYLELRTKTGVDGNVSAPNIMVTVAADVPASNKTSQFTWNLDMNPSTTSADGMTAGQTYNDPAGGLSFTVQDIDATHATINVTMDAATGSSTCMDGSTFTPPGSSTCTGLIVGGSGGMAGTGGATGMGGAAGASGSGGRGGGGGTAGRTNGGGGSGGAAGGATTASGGALTSGGAPTSGGALSSGGATSGGATSGGAATAGLPGAGAGAPTGTAGAAPPPVEGGCACRATPAAPSNSGAGALAVLAAGLVLRRRRASRT